MKKYIILLIIIMYSILPCLGNTYIKYEKIDSLINDISWKSIISNFNYITTFDVRKQLKNSLVNNNPYIISKLLSNLSNPDKTVAIHILLGHIFTPQRHILIFQDGGDSISLLRYNGLSFKLYNNNSYSIDEKEIKKIKEYWKQKVNDFKALNIRKYDKDSLDDINWNCGDNGANIIEPNLSLDYEQKIPLSALNNKANYIKYLGNIIGQIRNPDKAIAIHMMLTYDLMFNEYLNNYYYWNMPIVDGDKLAYNYNGIKFEYDKTKKSFKIIPSQIKAAFRFWKQKMEINDSCIVQSNCPSIDVGNRNIHVVEDDVIPHVQIDSMLLRKYAIVDKVMLRKLFYNINDEEKTMIISLILSRLSHTKINEKYKVCKTNNELNFSYGGCNFKYIHGEFYIKWSEIKRIRKFWEHHLKMITYEK